MVNFKKRLFVEHGGLFGLVTIRPRMQFRHQLPTWASTNEKEELFLQEVQLDTQQAVINAQFDTKDPASGTTVGYLKKYEHLRTQPDIIAGRMQNDAEQTWHTGQDFSGTVPSLGNCLRVSDLEVEHIFQDQTADAVQIYCYFDNRIGKRSLLGRGPI